MCGCRAQRIVRFASSVPFRTSCVTRSKKKEDEVATAWSSSNLGLLSPFFMELDKFYMKVHKKGTANTIVWVRCAAYRTFPAVGSVSNVVCD